VSARRAKLITVTDSPRSEPARDPATPPERAVDRLPISEVAFDRPGSPSPFGEDVTFPLPIERLQYRHT
jgi:hypothetical protein